MRCCACNCAAADFSARFDGLDGASNRRSLTQANLPTNPDQLAAYIFNLLIGGNTNAAATAIAQAAGKGTTGTNAIATALATAASQVIFVMFSTTYQACINPVIAQHASKVGSCKYSCLASGTLQLQSLHMRAREPSAAGASAMTVLLVYFRSADWIVANGNAVGRCNGKCKRSLYGTGSRSCSTCHWPSLGSSGKTLRLSKHGLIRAPAQ